MKKRVDKFYKDFYVMAIYETGKNLISQDMSNILNFATQYGCKDCIVEEMDNYVIYHWI